MNHQSTCGRGCPGEPHCTRTADIVTGTKRSELDYARITLFARSRELQKAHEYRLRSYKSDMAAVQACCDADRELQRASIEFTATLSREVGMTSGTLADTLRTLKDYIK